MYRESVTNNFVIHLKFVQHCFGYASNKPHVLDCPVFKISSFMLKRIHHIYKRGIFLNWGKTGNAKYLVLGRCGVYSLANVQHWRTIQVV